MSLNQHRHWKPTMDNVALPEVGIEPGTLVLSRSNLSAYLSLHPMIDGTDPQLKLAYLVFGRMRVRCVG